MRNIDGKFSTDGTTIFNNVSGEQIPQDEPLFLVRGRDFLAVQLLESYYELCSGVSNELHMNGILQVIDEFKAFAKQFPQRMKEPGKTRHLKLKNRV